MNQITTSCFQETYAKKVLNRAQQRAKRSGLPCDLTLDDLAAFWVRCGGNCEVTGRPFTKDVYEDCQVKEPFAPSLDRIDCHRGYTKANTRLVCIAVNFAMNQWGVEVIFN